MRKHWDKTHTVLELTSEMPYTFAANPNYVMFSNPRKLIVELTPKDAKRFKKFTEQALGQKIAVRLFGIDASEMELVSLIESGIFPCALNKNRDLIIERIRQSAYKNALENLTNEVTTNEPKVYENQRDAIEHLRSLFKQTNDGARISDTVE